MNKVANSKDDATPVGLQQQSINTGTSLVINCPGCSTVIWSHAVCKHPKCIAGRTMRIASMTTAKFFYPEDNLDSNPLHTDSDSVHSDPNQTKAIPPKPTKKRRRHDDDMEI